MADSTQANHLVDETSPYLLQHVHNPVDWYPWGEAALAKARKEDKPIFLSIGYSACHWCHVMERESFENEAIADFLNEHFVSIKVDREERPDLDHIYMDAVQIMTGEGGWPMSVWLTPDLKPFYSGTYFPPEQRWGRAGFLQVLEELAKVWREDRGKADQVGVAMARQLEVSATAHLQAESKTLSLAPLAHVDRYFDANFDEQYGGFGEAPKFPPSHQLRALLHVHQDCDPGDPQRERIAQMVETTLVRMASGGIYDQLGGGFHRYSVDEKWLIPHFEKMLYDNALLTQAYVEAWQVTRRPFYARIATETLDYVLREMVSDDGGFYSAQDADSEGVEGKFFVWTPAQLAEVLGPDDARQAAEFWGVTEGGNFEHGSSAPNRLHAVDDIGIDGATAPLPAPIEGLRQRLFEAREQRVKPATDTKVIAAWNGMMISAMARAGAVLGEVRFVEAARAAAEFVASRMVEGQWSADDFHLMRTHKDGRARFRAYLDDYAFLAAGYLDLFEASAELVWLERAEALVDRTRALFGSPDGGFYYTAPHHEHLIVRRMDIHDGATPSGNSVAIMNLLRLAVLRGRPELRDAAEVGLQVFFPTMLQYPAVMTEMLQALDFHLRGAREIVVMAAPGQTTESELARLARETYVPNAVTLVLEVNEAPTSAWTQAVPLLAGKGTNGATARAYICREGVCTQPTNDAQEMRGLLIPGNQER